MSTTEDLEDNTLGRRHEKSLLLPETDTNGIYGREGN